MYSLSEIKELVTQEGIIYTVCAEVDPDEIEDKRLAALWKTVRDSLGAVEEFLENSDSE